MAWPAQFEKVLVIGAYGALAQAFMDFVASTHHHVSLLGVDTRQPQRENTDRLRWQKIKYNRSHFEKLFRNDRFDVVFHLGRMSHTVPKAHLRELYDINVLGTQRVLELARRFHVKKTVIMSTYHVYGAMPDNPHYLLETHPLRASAKDPLLRDIVEMDQGVSSFMWHYRDEMDVVLLRPCNIIGSDIRNVMTSYLIRPYMPVAMDFKPMFQFIHKDDFAKLLAKSLSLPSGAYNVASGDSISMMKAKEILGLPFCPAPMMALDPLLRLMDIKSFIPAYFLDYLRYSCVISPESLFSELKLSSSQLTSYEALRKLKAGLKDG